MICDHISPPPNNIYPQITLHYNCSFYASCLYQMTLQIQKENYQQPKFNNFQRFFVGKRRLFKMSYRLFLIKQASFQCRLLIYSVSSLSIYPTIIPVISLCNIHCYFLLQKFICVVCILVSYPLLMCKIYQVSYSRELWRFFGSLNFN